MGGAERESYGREWEGAERKRWGMGGSGERGIRNQMHARKEAHANNREREREREMKCRDTGDSFSFIGCTY